MRIMNNWEFTRSIGLTTKWLRILLVYYKILSLGGIDKIRNHLVVNPIDWVNFQLFNET